jgi:hypothetical protein
LEETQQKTLAWLWRKLLGEEEKQSEDKPREETVEENCRNLVPFVTLMIPGCENVNNDDL